MRIDDDMKKILKHYVYIYIDPRNNEPFYIGSGTGNRMFSHLYEKSDREKVKKINAIRKAGKKPNITLLRYGLSKTESFLVEAAAIDLISKSKLTNLMAGHHEKSFGRIDFDDLMAIIKPSPVVVKHKALLITINKLYRSDITSLELYEATRGVWKLGPDREKAEYAMAIYQGVVREVYKIHKWYPGGTLKYQTREKENVFSPTRWEFEGKIARDIRDLYIGRFVGKSGQNPIRYINIKE